MTKKFLNILDEVEIEQPATPAASESTMASESGVLKNDVHGQCPKCSGVMGKGMLGTSGEEVYYCKSCRVSGPLEISE